MVGSFEKDKGFAGGFMDNWKSVLSKFSTEDMSNSMAYIMAPKVWCDFSTNTKSSISHLNLVKNEIEKIGKELFNF